LGLLVATGSAHAAPSPATLAPLPPKMACGDVARADLSNATGAPTSITSATEVVGLKPYCKVLGTIAPKINFEIRLPLSGWSQRFLQTGCGGLCGKLSINIEKAGGCAPVTNGEIALASSDMGHQANDMAWGNNTQQREDFAQRGVHLTAVAAKALIAAFYGQAPRYSYFSGCSDGGREALIEAQRYPGDFDGITAGAPAMHFSVQNSMHHAWLARSNTGTDGKAILTAVDMPVLHRAALRRCDARDGLRDGQIDDPRRCRFNPAVTLCKAAVEPGKCLTSIQVGAARKLYDGARDAHGVRLDIAGMQPGSELEWIGVFIPKQPGGPIFSEKIALDSINGLMFATNPSPPLTLADWKFDSATFASLAGARKLYDADNPDLSPFAAHGGKLILWHGWSDPHISPINTIDYFQQLGSTMGAARRDGSVRLFLFPAMAHCSGGDGPNEFPLLAALMAWVEGGAAPDVLVAKRFNEVQVPPRPATAAYADGGVPPMAAGPVAAPAARPQLPPRSRPVYAYPIVARYTGKGSVDVAANFKSFTPPAVIEHYDWLGARK
jgi:hypothetical protein